MDTPPALSGPYIDEITALQAHCRDWLQGHLGNLPEPLPPATNAGFLVWYATLAGASYFAPLPRRFRILKRPNLLPQSEDHFTETGALVLAMAAYLQGFPGVTEAVAESADYQGRGAKNYTGEEWKLAHTRGDMSNDYMFWNARHLYLAGKARHQRKTYHDDADETDRLRAEALGVLKKKETEYKMRNADFLDAGLMPLLHDSYIPKRGPPDAERLAAALSYICFNLEPTKARTFVDSALGTRHP
ncbi:MAG: hypothetical protein AB7G06_06485 [Bdellovibrionales bacterium]